MTPEPVVDGVKFDGPVALGAVWLVPALGLFIDSAPVEPMVAPLAAGWQGDALWVVDGVAGFAAPGLGVVCAAASPVLARNATTAIAADRCLLCGMLHSCCRPRLAMSEMAQSCGARACLKFHARWNSACRVSQPQADSKSFHRTIHNRASPVDSPKRPSQLGFRLPYLLMVTAA